MARRILIIDDERDMRVYLKTLLRRAGYETAVAASAEEGLSLARSFAPDLVTLDILMPRRSGIKAYETLRDTPATKGIPVVFLTGLTDHEQIRREIGAAPPPELIVDKPIDRDDFLRRLEEIIDGRA
jgi:CheY-like chemotaxis protein